MSIETDMQTLYGSPLQRVERAAQALRNGKGILLTDDEDRENEGNLIFSAVKMQVEDMVLMIRYCSGIVCLCMPPRKIRSLKLPLMTENNTSRYGTAEGVTIGVSASDRIRTIRAVIAEDATPQSFHSPGHVFPLVARENGVFERDGHPEGSVDLMKIAGLPPYSVLCELTNEDGKMARLPEIIRFAREHDFPVVTINDIKLFRRMQYCTCY